MPVERVDGGRAHSDQELVVRGNGLFDVLEPQHFG
jgi:hypothetical protein